MHLLRITIRRSGGDRKQKMNGTKTACVLVLSCTLINYSEASGKVYTPFFASHIERVSYTHRRRAGDFDGALSML